MYANIVWTEEDPSTGEIDYREVDLATLRNLSFSPQSADMSATTLPVNEYTCEIITDEDIPFDNAAVTLYDDRDRLWCAWPVRKALRTSANTVQITAASWLWRLKYRELDEEMFSDKTAAAAIADCFGTGHEHEYTVRANVQNLTLTGFAPQQNALERLAWIVFTLGLFVSDIFRSDAYITKVDETETLIPYESIYWRPSVDRADWVTGLKVTAYTFRQGTQEEWESSDSSYMFPIPWIATEQTFTINNPAAPSGEPPHVVEIDGIYLVNPNNVSDIMARLVQYWFNPTEVTLDCINNRQYKPGDLVTAYTAEEQLVTGYIQQASYAFGKQAKSTLKLVGTESVAGARLTVNYTYQGGVIGTQKFFFPVGFTFTFTNPYIDRTYKNRRYIYRPQSESITDTMVDGGLTVTQPCDLVLEYRDEKLYVYSVDSVVKRGDSGNYTGVIS